MLVRVGIFLIASAIIVLAWLNEEYDEDEQGGLFGGLTTCRFNTSEIFFSSANSPVSDDNAREYLIVLILALDYTYSTVLSMSFCTHLMGTPFFSEPSLHMEYYRTP